MAFPDRRDHKETVLHWSERKEVYSFGFGWVFESESMQADSGSLSQLAQSCIDERYLFRVLVEITDDDTKDTVTLTLPDLNGISRSNSQTGLQGCLQVQNAAILFKQTRAPWGKKRQRSGLFKAVQAE
ncbi:hypothetical protein F5887DRAFT_93756 [Amanita rubescens]|nr:hypothetical protein F5887DRAFT_93756 [Amanita rubescens]